MIQMAILILWGVLIYTMVFGRKWRKNIAEDITVAIVAALASLGIWEIL